MSWRFFWVWLVFGLFGMVLYAFLFGFSQDPCGFLSTRQIQCVSIP